jgi:hypothetical protein
MEPQTPITTEAKLQVTIYFWGENKEFVTCFIEEIGGKNRSLYLSPSFFDAICANTDNITITKLIPSELNNLAKNVWTTNLPTPSLTFDGFYKLITKPGIYSEYYRRYFPPSYNMEDTNPLYNYPINYKVTDFILRKIYDEQEFFPTLAQQSVSSSPANISTCRIAEMALNNIYTILDMETKNKQLKDSFLKTRDHFITSINPQQLTNQTSLINSINKLNIGLNYIETLLQGNSVILAKFTKLVSLVREYLRYLVSLVKKQEPGTEVTNIIKKITDK